MGVARKLEIRPQRRGDPRRLGTVAEQDPPDVFLRAGQRLFEIRRQFAELGGILVRDAADPQFQLGDQPVLIGQKRHAKRGKVIRQDLVAAVVLVIADDAVDAVPRPQFRQGCQRVEMLFFHAVGEIPQQADDVGRERVGHGDDLRDLFLVVEIVHVQIGQDGDGFALRLPGEGGGGDRHVPDAGQGQAASHAEDGDDPRRYQFRGMDLVEQGMLPEKRFAVELFPTVRPVQRLPAGQPQKERVGDDEEEHEDEDRDEDPRRKEDDPRRKIRREIVPPEKLDDLELERREECRRARRGLQRRTAFQRQDR